MCCPLTPANKTNPHLIHPHRLPPPNTPYSADLWAPELHSLRGRWYVYFAAANPEQGNRSHRMYVLGGPPSTSDPHDQSGWEFLGPLQNMDQKQWAIDGTVFELDNNELYFAYSGWPLDRAPDDFNENTQQIFIARMSDPTTLASPPVMISSPDRDWERSDDKGINEGPQFLSSPASSPYPWRGLAYSCAGSWTKEYKMATLHLLPNSDPLNPQSWKKSFAPLIQNSGENGKGPFGPGHGNFVRVGDETMVLVGTHFVVVHLSCPQAVAVFS
jgi:GH43 family beta-xylosidase